MADKSLISLLSGVYNIPKKIGHRKMGALLQFGRLNVLTSMMCFFPNKSSSWKIGQVAYKIDQVADRFLISLLSGVGYVAIKTTRNMSAL